MRIQALDLVRSSHAVRDGAPLAALFGWLLGMPMFGPVLFAAAAENAPVLGLLFVCAHGAALAALPFARAPAGGVVVSGVVASGATLVFPLVAGYLPAAVVLTTAMAIAAAFLVLAWAEVYLHAEDPVKTLGIAMAGANLLLAVLTLPLGTVMGPASAGTLALVGALGVRSLRRSPLATAISATPSPALPPGAAWKVALPLGAFAIADYFAGGLWYQLLPISPAQFWPWWPTLESLLYVIVIPTLCLGVMRRSPASLASLGLSSLGLGLLLAAFGAGATGSIVGYRALLVVGLAAGDLFFWYHLGMLAGVWGARRTFGIGLGSSLGLISLAVMVARMLTPGPEGPGRPILLTGAALLFGVVPLVFRFSAEPGRSLAARERPTVRQGSPAAPPPGLTPTEREVWKLLVEGAEDQEIAARIRITAHTVKFHVRNILRKTGAANRKELLSRLVRRVLDPDESGR